MTREAPLPEHSPVPHQAGKWMAQTCERCRRQAVGQRKLLAWLLPEWKFNEFYGGKARDS